MMHQDSYITVKAASEGLYKEKGSKFFAYLKPLADVTSFEEFILSIKKLHPKARHLCYAYLFQGENGDPLFRINDDGEPSGTAGKPIYGQILSADLINIAIVVVRYFGGTKLGASGLIRAYKTAAEDAINNAELITKFNTEKIIISFDYEKMGNLLKALKDLNIKISNTNYNADPQLEIEVNQSEVDVKIKEIKAKLLYRGFEDIVDDDVVDGLKFVIQGG